MKDITINIGTLDVLDVVAGANVTDIVLANAMRNGLDHCGRDGFEEMPMEQQVERVFDAMDESAVEA